MLKPFQDNRTYSAHASPRVWSSIEDHRESLKTYSGVSLTDLDRMGVLVFPPQLNAQGDDIGENAIYTLSDRSLSTGNIVGFLGWDDVELAIRSRFDKDERQYFLHYMLMKVFGLHIADLETSKDPESLWSFLPYLFPYCLKNAMRQGLYRAYRTFHYNDDRVRGTVKVPSFIQRDIPFQGNVAYSTREHTANNPVFHLVRHTIETLRVSKRFTPILKRDKETQECVRTVSDVTPDFSRNDLRKILHENAKIIRHPYYTKYSALQKLCIQILRRNKLSYGKDNQKIYGILFDAAWLWEEYLNTLLSRLQFKHPQNKRGAGAEYLYADNTGEIYPDFLSKSRKIVLDAKYKRLDKKGLREDRFQIITYIHVLWKDATDAKGYLVYPSGNSVDLSQSEQAQDEASFTKIEGTLKEGGGTLGTIAFKVPSLSENENFSDFCAKMKAEEERFLDNKIFQQSPQS